MPPAIEVENLSKRYRLTHVPEGRAAYATLRDELARLAAAPLRWWKGHRSTTEEFWALKDVSFCVQPGEVVGIVGRNGAGKSTLLKIISRITEPSAGRITMRGRVGSLLEVGTGFHAELTGRENIFLAGAILGMKRAEIRQKFGDIVGFAEIDKFLDTPVKRYSSGMYMRLAFAVAAHLETEILLVDEVLAVGDAEFQKKCLGKMEEVAGEGRTVLFVSHNLNAVEELCEKVVLLQSGKAEKAQANVRDVIQHYLTGGGAASSQSEWLNSGRELANPWFQPLSFRLVNELNQLVAGPTRNDAKLSVIVEGKVDVVDDSLNVGYALYSRGGELLYWTLTTDSKHEDWPVIERGRIAFQGPIPSRFLNEGDYRLELIASLHCRKWLSQPEVNAPTLAFTIQGGLSASPFWLTPRPGLLGPVLQWRRAS